MIAFLSAGMPSAGVYFTSPVLRRDAQLTMASMGALLFGSPPPRWITGSPLSRSSAAVSFSLRVGDSEMDFASWLRLMPYYILQIYSDSRLILLEGSTLVYRM